MDKIYESKAGRFVINSLIKSDNKYFISGDAHPSGKDNPVYSETNNQIYLNSRKHRINSLTLSHELFHAFQDDNEEWAGAGLEDCNSEFGNIVSDNWSIILQFRTFWHSFVCGTTVADKRVLNKKNNKQK